MADAELVNHLAARIAAACDLLARGIETADDLIDDDLARAQSLNETARNTRALLLAAIVDLIDPPESAGPT